MVRKAMAVEAKAKADTLSFAKFIVGELFWIYESDYSLEICYKYET
jgi:hypothetical protein